ncbi:MAG: response regulator receiver protein [Verrucomicrobiales bacterium]|nr:response regulator receiver protein [Verrucomicrobiales bacterium]
MDSGSTILLVDDSEDDVFLFEHCLTKNKYPFKIHLARNGLEAMNYLEGKEEFSDRVKFPIPQFIITDNKMPLVTGKEFLTWLKEHPRYSVVPTLFFSGFASPKEVDYAYATLGVHSYIFKPESPEQLERYIKLIFDYWSICAIPACK